MTALSPAERAQFDQLLEEAISRSLRGAALYDDIDTAEAIREYAMNILAPTAEVDLRSLAVAVAGLSVRLHRGGSR